MALADVTVTRPADEPHKQSINVNVTSPFAAPAAVLRQIGVAPQEVRQQAVAAAAAADTRDRAASAGHLDRSHRCPCAPPPRPQPRPPSPPPPPKMKGPPSAADVGPRSLRLSWDEPDNADTVTAYLVQRASDAKVGPPSAAGAGRLHLLPLFLSPVAAFCPTQRKKYETLERVDTTSFAVEVRF